MRNRRIGWRFGWASGGVVLLLAGITAVSTHRAWFSQPPDWSHVPTAEVRRTDLTALVTTGGRIDSSERTTIECELEALDVGVQGVRIATNGASTTSDAPDGSMVKKGDVLAVLDSSSLRGIAVHANYECGTCYG